jgi:hypothetical protein
MLDLSRWLLSFFIIVLLFENFSSALEIGISPSEIEFDVKEGEILCKGINLFSDKEVSVSSIDYWTNGGKSRSLGDYFIKPEDFDISLDYPSRFSFNESDKINVCLTGIRGGIFYGALIFDIEGTNKGIGAWIRAVVRSEKESGPIISSNVIRDFDFPAGDNKNILVFLCFEVCFLIILLGFLILIVKRRKNLSNETRFFVK